MWLRISGNCFAYDMNGQRSLATDSGGFQVGWDEWGGGVLVDQDAPKRPLGKASLRCAPAVVRLCTFRLPAGGGKPGLVHVCRLLRHTPAQVFLLGYRKGV